MPFTPAELEAMRLADEEIEREFAEKGAAEFVDREIEKWLDEIVAYQAAYREAHKDEIAAYQAAYYEAHKDEIATKKAAYYEAHKDEIAAYQAAYREENRDSYNAYMREYMREYRKRRRRKEHVTVGRIKGESYAAV